VRACRLKIFIFIYLLLLIINNGLLLAVVCLFVVAALIDAGIEDWSAILHVVHSGNDLIVNLKKKEKK
jgi:hypothetical protein